MHLIYNIQYLRHQEQYIYDVKNLMGLTLPEEECLNMVISRALTHFSLSSASRAEKKNQNFYADTSNKVTWSVS